MIGVERMRGDEGGRGGRGIRSSVIFVINVAVDIIFFVVIVFVIVISWPCQRPVVAGERPCAARRHRSVAGPSSSSCPVVFVLLSSAVARFRVSRVWALFPGMSLPDSRPWRHSLPAAGYSPVSHARRRLRRQSSVVAAASAPLPLIATGAISIVDGGAECPARGRWCHHPSEILAPAVSHEVRGASCSSLRCAGGKVPSFIDAPLVESAASVPQCCLLAAFPIGCCLDGALLLPTDCAPAAPRLIRLSPVLTANLPPVLSKTPSNADRSATSPRLCPFP